MRPKNRADRGETKVSERWTGTAIHSAQYLDDDEALLPRKLLSLVAGERNAIVEIRV